MRSREDTGSRTEADASAFERRFASDAADDRPSLSDLPRDLPPHNCWRNGGVECRRCELEEMREEALLAAAPDAYGIGYGPAT